MPISLADTIINSTCRETVASQNQCKDYTPEPNPTSERVFHPSLDAGVQPYPCGDTTPKPNVSSGRTMRTSWNAVVSQSYNFLPSRIEEPRAAQTSSKKEDTKEKNTANVENGKKEYFCGNFDLEVKRKHTNSQGEYLVEIGDHIANRYEIVKEIDSGSFGKVLECIDHKIHKSVAIKVFKKANESKRLANHEYKVCNLLSKSKTQTYIYKVKKLFEFRHHYFIVFELLNQNLTAFIEKNHCNPLSKSLVKRIVVQLLGGLSYIHSQNIIHCDLKPENILFLHPNKSSIRVIDFGHSCFTNQKIHDYIQSRFYRAPEIMLQCGYGTPIDVWSLGCVVGEMLLGVPIFQGNDEKEMIGSIITVLGMPPERLVKKSRAKHLLKNDLLTPRRVPLKTIFCKFDTEIIKFLESCLKWEPEERITAQEGLNCIWIKRPNSRSCSAS